MQRAVKYLILFNLLFGTITLYGQKYKKPKNLVQYDNRKLHFGFTLGINELNFTISWKFLLNLMVLKDFFQD